MAHGNDKKTYENEVNSVDTSKYLNHSIATMVEYNGYSTYNSEMDSRIEKSYNDDLRGLSHKKPTVGANN